ncbi:MAG: hypothetical protein U5L45_26635 [Saprospiraceae bacterium]|nr:hypothetical protein [Saprospiraceae bacterium]
MLRTCFENAAGMTNFVVRISIRRKIKPDYLRAVGSVPMNVGRAYGS